MSLEFARLLSIANLYHSASRSVTVQYDDFELAFHVVANTRLSDDVDDEGISVGGSPVASNTPFSCRIVVVSELVRIGGSGFYRWKSEKDARRCSVLPCDVVAIADSLGRP